MQISITLIFHSDQKLKKTNFQLLFTRPQGHKLNKYLNLKTYFEYLKFTWHFNDFQIRTLCTLKHNIIFVVDYIKTALKFSLKDNLSLWSCNLISDPSPKCNRYGFQSDFRFFFKINSSNSQISKQCMNQKVNQSTNPPNHQTNI